MKLVNLTRPVTAQWLVREGRRLDAGPFLSGAVEARLLLEQLDVPKEPLHTLTKGHNGGIYHAGREARKWVDSTEHGVPFLSSSSVLNADLSDLPLISKKQIAQNPLFTIHKDWILITRSGTIGRMVYAREDMDGMACSEHVMRVVPDPEKIPPGYLYAYLSGKYGVPLIVSGTYGAIIQHIEPEHIAKLSVPRFGHSEEVAISQEVERAAKARSEAARLLCEADKAFAHNCDLTPLQVPGQVTSFSCFIVKSGSLSRLDPTYSCPSASQAITALASARPGSRRLGDIGRVFTPSIFKRIRVDDADYGYPYFGGSELFQSNPAPRGYLSKGAPRIEDYLVHTDWLLVQDAGQLGGLIGRPVRVAGNQDMSAVSNHMVRMCFEDVVDAAFVFACLKSSYGYLALTRLAFGSSIPQLEPSQVADIPIPWPAPRQRQEVADLVLKAWKKQDQADACDVRATDAIGKLLER